MKYVCVRACWHKRPNMTKAKLYKLGEIIDVMGNEPSLPRHFVKADTDVPAAIREAEIEERQKIVRIRAERKEAAKAEKAAKAGE